LSRRPRRKILAPRTDFERSPARGNLVDMKFTRRKLAAIAFAPAAAQLAAQTPPSAPADDLQAARDRIKANSQTLAQQDVGMQIEPSFQFKP
jgi:hypothetical protein